MCGVYNRHWIYTIDKKQDIYMSQQHLTTKAIHRKLNLYKFESFIDGIETRNVRHCQGQQHFVFCPSSKCKLKCTIFGCPKINGIFCQEIDKRIIAETFIYKF